MTWTEIANKYKGIELMKEFFWFVYDNKIGEAEEEKRRLFWRKFEGFNIKDIWGYLIIFADEIKGYSMISDLQTAYYNEASKTWLRLEPSMVWCIEEFFEMYK